MKKIKGFQVVCIFLLSVLTASAQEAGRTFIRNFPFTEYRASSQNWAIAQDSRGIMYFANSEGLLEYDGISWKLIKLPVVRTIAIDSLGRIYVGMESDIGYLEPDHAGNYQYYSLKAKIPEKYRELTPVYYSFILGDEVIFSTRTCIFIYKNDQVKVFFYERGFGRASKVRNNIYFREKRKRIILPGQRQPEICWGQRIFCHTTTQFHFTLWGK